MNSNDKKVLDLCVCDYCGEPYSLGSGHCCKEMLSPEVGKMDDIDNRIAGIERKINTPAWTYDAEGCRIEQFTSCCREDALFILRQLKECRRENRGLWIINGNLKDTAKIDKDELKKCRGENEILCQPYCAFCGEPIGGSTFNKNNRYEITTGCGCIEQRTKEACKKAGKEWIDETFVFPENIRTTHLKEYEQAIDEAKGK